MSGPKKPFINVNMDWEQISPMLGFKSGVGVLGRALRFSGTLALAIMVVAFSLKSHPWIAALIILPTLALAAFVVHLVFKFAHENPLAAVLEDAELVRTKELEQMAANIEDVVPEQPLVVNQPPKSITLEDEKDA